jgi:hypothetical protein
VHRAVRVAAVGGLYVARGVVDLKRGVGQPMPVRQQRLDLDPDLVAVESLLHQYVR